MVPCKNYFRAETGSRDCSLNMEKVGESEKCEREGNGQLGH